MQTDRLTVHEETSMNVVVREDNEVHPSSSSSSSSLLSLQTTHPDPTPSDPKTNRTPPKEKDKKKKKKNESSQRTSRVRTRLKVARVNTHARSRSRQHGQPTPTPSGSEVHPPTAAPSHTTHPPLHVRAATQPIVNPLHEDDQDQSPTVTLPVFAFTAPSALHAAQPGHSPAILPPTVGNLDSFFNMDMVSTGLRTSGTTWKTVPCRICQENVPFSLKTTGRRVCHLIKQHKLEWLGPPPLTNRASASQGSMAQETGPLTTLFTPLVIQLRTFLEGKCTSDRDVSEDVLAWLVPTVDSVPTGVMEIFSKLLGVSTSHATPQATRCLRQLPLSPKPAPAQETIMTATRISNRGRSRPAFQTGFAVWVGGNSSLSGTTK